MVSSSNPHDQLDVLALIQEFLDYDRAKGIFTWKKRSGPRCVLGSQAGCQNNRGYHHIKLKGLNLKVHRLVWLVENGVWPESILDHIDGDTSNNQISNLREVTYRENQFNRKLATDNSSGHRGVSWHVVKQKWSQYISNTHLGYFNSKEEAIAERLKAEKSSQVFIRNN